MGSDPAKEPFATPFGTLCAPRYLGGKDLEMIGMVGDGWEGAQDSLRSHQRDVSNLPVGAMAGSSWDRLNINKTEGTSQKKSNGGGRTFGARARD